MIATLQRRELRQPGQLCYSHRKPKGPVCRNTIGKAVAAPTDKRGFVMPDFDRSGVARCGMVYGHGGGYPQGRPHGFTRVTNRHAHPLPVVRLLVDSESRKGVPTMTQAINLVRPAAPIVTIKRPAAPVPSALDTTAPDVIALHIAAENALSMALSMLRNPAGTAADLQRATARVIRASSLLKRACAAQVEGGAA